MKYKITFLFDINNDWIKDYFDSYNFEFNKNKKFSINTTYNLDNIRKQDVVFPLSYTKILSEDFLKINKEIIIAHPSKLPKDKGFAPLANQILRGQSYFYISLIKAEQKVDEGKIYIQKKFKLNGTELNSEIRKAQAVNIFRLIDSFLQNFPKNKSFRQKGIRTFNKRRKSKDSQIDINKSIKKQFNLLRVVDNEKYPAFFIFNKKKYILKIYKSEDPLIKNFKLRFIVKKTKELKQKEINSLINLKKKYWKYSTKSHEEWFKKNIKDNDIHFLGKKNEEVMMYCCLREREIIVKKNIKKFYYLDTLCSYKQYNKIFSFMSLINKIIDKNFCILICDKKHVKFYQKFNFKISKKYNFTNHTIKKFKVLFKIDKSNKDFNFFSKRRINFKI